MEFRTDGVRSGETNTNVHFEFSKMEISWSDIDRDPRDRSILVNINVILIKQIQEL
jgi:hypothetical protein